MLPRSGMPQSRSRQLFLLATMLLIVMPIIIFELHLPHLKSRFPRYVALRTWSLHRSNGSAPGVQRSMHTNHSEARALDSPVSRAVSVEQVEARFAVPESLWPPSRAVIKNASLEMKTRIAATKRLYITYGERCCVDAKARACRHAKEYGKFDACKALSQADVDQPFQKRNKDIFNVGRGAGLWLWKPYIINKTLHEDLQEGEYLVYVDAGAFIKSPIDPMLAFMEVLDSKLQGVLTFGVGFPQFMYCKRDSFVIQNCDSTECHEAMQVDGYLSVWRKSKHALQVAQQWLIECQNFQSLSDEGPQNVKGKPNLPGFRAHRHDQALLTNIITREKWGRDTEHGPVQFMFSHDRFKS
uniref:Uncharacterized protein n=1 Tax=Hanusia phi TaxID=3032 RepID=A0A7S0DZ16_9CRYP|mmetsp:Transcript_13344/g.30714  ORF Transcript_13344/g.30714 Transcript_13344/m.30714 type:complete len:355 (+) Transcript_13344:244-1308(+)